MLFYGIIVEKSALRCRWYHIWFHVSYIVHDLLVLFQGWDVGTLGNTISGCVTQDPRVGPSLEACAIHPIYLVCFVACTSEP